MAQEGAGLAHEGTVGDTHLHHATTGEPTQLDREVEDEEHRYPECGHGVEDHAEISGRDVECLVASPAGEHADDDTDDGGKEGAGADQDQRRHDSPADDLSDGLLLRVGVTKVTLDRIDPVVAELFPEWSVEMEHLLLLREGRGREVALWQEQTRRIARKDAEEHEVEASHQDDGEQRIEDLLGEVAPLVHVSDSARSVYTTRRLRGLPAEGLPRPRLDRLRHLTLDRTGCCERFQASSSTRRRRRRTRT